jgi:hypothetical protein
MLNLRLFIFLFFCILSAHGQKYINDSAIVKIYQNPRVKAKSFQIYNINDKREHAGPLFHIGEKKRYGIVPVDYLYVFQDPLDTGLENAMKDSIETSAPGYAFDILYFRPGIKKGGIISQYYLDACVRMRSPTGTNQNDTLGYWVYHTTLAFKSAPLDSSELPDHKTITQIKANKKLAYEKLIYNWQSEFVTDVNNFIVTPPLARSFILPNYKPPGYVYRKNLYGFASALAGKDWYGIEGELFISSPETGRPFVRNTSTVRYIHARNYESILFGANNENFYWRLGPDALFQLQGKLLFGLNRWNDIETQEHGLEDIFQLCLSFSQMLQFNRLDKKGLVFSLGLVQDGFYIFNQLDYRLGLKMNVGFKL